MQSPAFSSAAIRNSEPILGVLRSELAGSGPVFEIGSGTGQHAVYFASAMPELLWQTSDLAEHHELIRARLAQGGLGNVLPPMLADMNDPPALDRRYGAVFSANTLHIMSMEAVRKLVPFVATILRAGGRFCYYGAFRRGGSYNAASNAAFDRALRERDARMGLRDLEEIDRMAADAGLYRERLYAMPANNLLVSWVKRSAT
jgi:cyclopropane fatty-acyl-phospholipid synthase-like methyltransferase